jgi:hypothetical protein
MQDIIFDLLSVGRFRQIYPEVSLSQNIKLLFTVSESQNSRLQNLELQQFERRTVRWESHLIAHILRR